MNKPASTHANNNLTTPTFLSIASVCLHVCLLQYFYSVVSILSYFSSNIPRGGSINQSERKKVAGNLIKTAQWNNKTYSESIERLILSFIAYFHSFTSLELIDHLICFTKPPWFSIDRSQFLAIGLPDIAQ